MVKHIVMWKMNDENKQENMKLIKERLDELKTKIPTINSLETGINENGGEYDFVLITAFKSFDDLKEYDTNPYHTEVKKIIKGVTSGRVAVDYEY